MFVIFRVDSSESTLCSGNKYTYVLYKYKTIILAKNSLYNKVYI